MGKDISQFSINDLKAYIQELEAQIKQDKKYGLVWDKENTPEQVVLDCKDKIPVLFEDESKRIIMNQTDNILIEGDNFHSLSSLLMVMENKIDFIYIDPPYNTGHQDFAYNDKFVEKSDGFRHSKWLSFMKRRLTLSKSLLNDNGIMFISIDDNEYANLKLLCDSIFGEANCLGTCVQEKGNAQNDALDIEKNHEYVLCYCKKKVNIGNSTKLKTAPHLYKYENVKKECFKDSDGFYFLNGGITTGGQGSTLKARPNLGYTIYYNPQTKDLIAIDDYKHELIQYVNNERDIYITNEELVAKGYVAIRPPKHKGMLGVWTWSLETFNSCKQHIFITVN